MTTSSLIELPVVSNSGPTFNFVESYGFTWVRAHLKQCCHTAYVSNDWRFQQLIPKRSSTYSFPRQNLSRFPAHFIVSWFSLVHLADSGTSQRCQFQNTWFILAQYERPHGLLRTLYPESGTISRVLQAVTFWTYLATLSNETDCLVSNFPINFRPRNPYTSKIFDHIFQPFE